MKKWTPYHKVYENDQLDDLLDHVKSNTDVLIHNTGFISMCHLLNQTKKHMETASVVDSLSLLRIELYRVLNLLSFFTKDLRFQ